MFFTDVELVELCSNRKEKHNNLFNALKSKIEPNLPEFYFYDTEDKEYCYQEFIKPVIQTMALFISVNMSCGNTDSKEINKMIETNLKLIVIKLENYYIEEYLDDLDENYDWDADDDAELV